MYSMVIYPFLEFLLINALKEICCWAVSPSTQYYCRGSYYSYWEPCYWRMENAAEWLKLQIQEVTQVRVTQACCSKV